MNAGISTIGNRTTRELDFRASAGIEVTLLWNSRTDELAVTVFDSKTDELFELAAEPERALDVFNHPFAYAARCASCIPLPAASPLDRLRATKRED